MSEHRRPVVVDLYAGAGGLSLGMEQAGFDVVAAVEMDPVHAQVHRYNFPNTPLLAEDLNSVSPDQVIGVARSGWDALGRAEPMEIDAVVGGPPCQGFSTGGVRDMSDERNSQLLKFVEFVVALKPKVFFLENVAGLLEGRFDDLRAHAIRELTRAGYSVAGYDRSVNASDFGIPQNRRRVLIMGGLDETPVLGEGDLVPVTVGDAFAGLPDLRRYRRLLRSDAAQLDDDDLGAMLVPSSPYARRLVGLEPAAFDLSYPRRRELSLLTNSLRTVHTSKTVQRFSKTPPGSVEPVSRLYRLAPDGLSRTLRAGTGTDRGSHTSPRPIHPDKSRVITVREAARLHGYPDWFRFHGTNWHGHRQVGNSVPPPLAAAAGRALVRALGATIEPPSTLCSLGDPDWLWQGRADALASLASQSFMIGSPPQLSLAI